MGVLHAFCFFPARGFVAGAGRRKRLFEGGWGSALRRQVPGGELRQLYRDAGAAFGQICDVQAILGPIA